MDEQEQGESWEDGDGDGGGDGDGDGDNEYPKSPFGANPARFSVYGFNSEVLYYCMFNFFESNSTYDIMISLISEKQWLYHEIGLQIYIEIIDPKSKEEC